MKCSDEDDGRDPGTFRYYAKLLPWGAGKLWNVCRNHNYCFYLSFSHAGPLWPECMWPPVSLHSTADGSKSSDGTPWSLLATSILFLNCRNFLATHRFMSWSRGKEEEHLLWSCRRHMHQRNTLYTKCVNFLCYTHSVTAGSLRLLTFSTTGWKGKLSTVVHL